MNWVTSAKRRIRRKRQAQEALHGRRAGSVPNLSAVRAAPRPCPPDEAETLLPHKSCRRISSDELLLSSWAEIEALIDRQERSMEEATPSPMNANPLDQLVLSPISVQAPLPRCNESENKELTPRSTDLHFAAIDAIKFINEGTIVRRGRLTPLAADPQGKDIHPDHGTYSRLPPRLSLHPPGVVAQEAAQQLEPSLPRATTRDERKSHLLVSDRSCVPFLVRSNPK